METIKDVKEHLASISSLDDPYLAELSKDSRAGVIKLIASKQKQIEKEAQKLLAFKKRFELEKELWNNGYKNVAGIDEVGRGCLAGPVVTAAVIVDESFSLIDVNDSKQLSANLREELYDQILKQAKYVSIGISDNTKIDEIGILNATIVAMQSAINGLEVKPDHLLIDAVKVPTDIPKSVMFKGDSKSISIAAASIVAKVYRDRLMRKYDEMYPGYNFVKNVGYGTKDHINGLKTLGVTPIHRVTFDPIPDFLN